MAQPSVNSTADSEIRASFQAHLAEARETLGLSRLVRDPTADLYPRYSGYYRQLCQLPRRVRRQLQRQWRRSLSALALLLALGQAPALAASITVAPGTPPAINGDGRCALIEAIDNANADAYTHTDCVAGNGADTIVLPTRSTQSLTAVDNTTHGPTGLPVITSALSIRGRHSTIRRESNAPEFRILAVASSGNLTLHNTTVSGGKGKVYYPNYFSGGGIANYGGTLTITNSTVSGNGVGFGGLGGGIANSGTATLTNSTLSGNSASGAGGMSNSGTATLTNSTVTGNSCGYGSGGGLFNSESGTLTLSRSTVSGNHSSNGGGMSNRGTAKMIDTTVSGNDTYDGSPSGGPFSSGGGVANTGTLTVSNSTVSGNSTGIGGGGGLHNDGSLTFSNSTVSGNSAGLDGAGGVLNLRGTLTLARTLISGNKNYYGPSEVEVDSRFGTVIANNHNLFGHDGDAGVLGFSPGPTDIVPNARLRAILKLLADNGGPTKTHALPVGSPAIGQSPANSGCKPTDQRGVTRPQGAACDIGSFEKGPPVRCNGRIARILGTVGNDRLIGTPRPDVIHGLAGRDIIDGLEGNDIICGGTGDDKLFGASGADRLNGGSGTDICNGGNGTDKGASCETETNIP